MKSILRFIKQQYKQPQNYLFQILLTQWFCFVALLFFRIVSLVIQDFYYFDTLIEKLSLSPNWRMLQQKPWTLFTYAFIKKPEGFGFISFFKFLLFVFNMHFWSTILIRFFNPKRFFQIYLISIFGGSLTLLFLSFYTYLPVKSVMALPVPVYGLMASTAALMPNYRIFFFFLRFKVKEIVLFFVVYLLATTYSPPTRASGFCYLGGMLASYLYTIYLQQKRFIHQTLAHPHWFFRLHRNRKNTNPSKREFDLESSQAKNSPTTRIEAILDKIAAEGYQSLTPEEKKVLFEA